jgi:hypothetical protein
LANFKTHMVVGTSVAGVSSTLLLSSGYFSSTDALLFFSLGSLASLMPDLDSDTSVPFKVTFSLLSVFLSFLVVFSKNQYSIIEMAILWFGIYFLIKNVFVKLFSELTVHRGIFHSVPMAVLFGILGTIILDKLFLLDSKISVWGGFFIFLGYITHLILDEVYSVDLSNRRFKKSFGTALSIYKKDNLLGTAILYILVFLLANQIENLNIISDTLLYKDFYMEIYANLLPEGEWFHGLLKI